MHEAHEAHEPPSGAANHNHTKPIRRFACDKKTVCTTMKSMSKRLLVVTLLIAVLEFTQKFFVLNQLISHQIEIEAKYSHSFGPASSFSPPSLQVNASFMALSPTKASPASEAPQHDIILPPAKFVASLRERQQQQQQSVQQQHQDICQTAPGKGDEGPQGFQALRKIRTQSQQTQQQPNQQKILCIVMTESSRHSEQMVAIRDTFASQCDGFLAASDQTDVSVGAVRVYAPSSASASASASATTNTISQDEEWERVKQVWDYVDLHHLYNFDFFYLVSDHAYVLPDNLRSFLQQKYADTDNEQDTVYTGGTVVASRKMPHQFHCGGGAGYIFNRKTLRVFNKQLAKQCTRQHHLPADQQIAHCLATKDILCQNSADDKQSMRFMEFGINYHASWNRQVKQTPLLYRPLKDLGVIVQPGLAGISKHAVSINAVEYAPPVKDAPTVSNQHIANNIRRLHAILNRECESTWNVPIDALDANGNPGYIHDATYIRNHPPAFQQHPVGDFAPVCTPPYGKGVEGQHGYEALQKIRSTTHPVQGPRVLCMIYTHSRRHDRVRAIAETYAAQCDGFLAASNKTDASIGAVNILHEGPEEYGNMWLKIRSMWQYAYKHYRDDYDYFHIGGDDHYMIPDNFRYMVSQPKFQQQNNMGKPLFLGGSMTDYPRTDTRYCGGGSGYTLNKAALNTLIEDLFDTHVCRPHYAASDEDRIISHCFQSIGLSCMDTNDDDDEARYHQANAEFHATWTHDTPHVWRAKELLESHNIVSKEMMGQISGTSVSFHLKGKARGVRDRGIRRYHAILNDMCPGK